MAYVEFTVEAQDLSGKHMGMEAYLPGKIELLPDRSGMGPWEHTWAPITLIQIKKDRTVKVRRHPDAHTDHVLAPTDEVQLRGEL